MNRRIGLVIAIAALLVASGPGCNEGDTLVAPTLTAECTAAPLPARHFAARFAAKEACFKALGAATPDGSSWREVEVRGTPSAARLALHGRLRRLAARHPAGRFLVSLAHTRDLAVAAVVFETEAVPPDAGERV